MTLSPPCPTRQRPTTAQSWDQNALWLMSFGDLMLLLLCFFILLTVVEQGSSRLNAATPLEASSIPPVSFTQGEARGIAPPARMPSLDSEMRQTTDDALYPTTHNDVYTESRREVRFSDYEEIQRSVDDETGHEMAAAQHRHTLPDGTPLQEVKLAPSDQIPTEEQVERSLREIFRPAGDRVEIEARPGAVTVRLRDTITFRSGSADLLPQVRPLLDRVAQLLVTQSEIRVETAGHTDEIPIATSAYPSNWELSAARAAAVARYLLARASIEPRRIEIAGYGEHRPVDTRPTAEGRARNRRVEIRFIHPLRSE